MVSVKQFWSWMGQRAISATVVAVDGRNGPAGFLGLSATHVSADPPLISVSVSRSTSALAEILARGRFAVSFLPEGGQDLVPIFGGSASVTGADRFRPGEWTTLTTGCPVHAQATGALDCMLEREIDLGHVLLLIGRVVDGAAREDSQPLILFRGVMYRSGSVD
ncbi:flavin reductase family protein [Microvirga massiliensis]|uniref:flavin reductase family protein n=1 Tax=Microvirga massiliensis TaxID=1033741 RepID=UPI00066079E9|nr:flavin reductase family protein [Microvirga massiliensis]